MYHWNSKWNNVNDISGQHFDFFYLIVAFDVFKRSSKKDSDCLSNIFPFSFTFEGDSKLLQTMTIRVKFLKRFVDALGPKGIEKIGFNSPQRGWNQWESFEKLADMVRPIFSKVCRSALTHGWSIFPPSLWICNQ